MTTLRTASQQALEALDAATSYIDGYYVPRGKTTLPEIEEAQKALRAALAQQDEPVWMHPWPPVRAQQAEPQTIDEAMQQPRALAQAYENGYKAGAAAERKRIIQFLTEMQRQVGDGHNYYGVAAMRIREME